jgi:hypothetical protein
MELQHVNAEIFVHGALAVDPERFIETFHRWIREQVVDGLWIDVADYRHVPHGPGIVLVGHEADYAMDHNQGRWGLLYNRKTALAGSNMDRVRQAIRAAAHACELLESEFSDLRFSRQEFEVIFNDRALVPNTPQTLAQVQPELQAILSELLGHGDFTMTHETDPRRRFGMTVKSQRPFELVTFA